MDIRSEREALRAPLGVVAALAHVHESRLSKGERAILTLTPDEERRVIGVLKRLREISAASPYPVDFRDPRRISRMMEAPLTRAM